MKQKGIFIMTIRVYKVDPGLRDANIAAYNAVTHPSYDTDSSRFDAFLAACESGMVYHSRNIDLPSIVGNTTVLPETVSIVSGYDPQSKSSFVPGTRKSCMLEIGDIVVDSISGMGHMAGPVGWIIVGPKAVKEMEKVVPTYIEMDYEEDPIMTQLNSLSIYSDKRVAA
jgi:hypothetical protein